METHFKSFVFDMRGFSDISQVIDREIEAWRASEKDLDSIVSVSSTMKSDTLVVIIAFNVNAEPPA